MRDHLEIITRTQAACKKWFKYRAGRITASNLHAVVHTSQQQPSIYLLRNICYPDVYSFKSSATEWGCLHEKDALEACKSAILHDDEGFKSYAVVFSFLLKAHIWAAHLMVLFLVPATAWE